MTRTSQSLERTAFETTETVKKVLLKYADNSMSVLIKLSISCLWSNSTNSTTCTNMQNDLAMHARPEVEKISPETDTSILAACLSSALALSIPFRTLYYNYDVGECSALVFGVSLADYATARGSQSNVPNILKLCIGEVDKRGLEAEGIYMVSSFARRVP